MAAIQNFGSDLLRYYSDDFNFNDYKPPLYEYTTVCWTIVGYLLGIRLTTWYMRSQEKPFNTKYIAALHNLFLFLISVAMFIGSTTTVYQNYRDGGFNAIMCNSNGYYRKTKFFFWAYIFYLTKPYEFIDTYIMIFKKRELNFLHVWHHCTTFLLVWVTQVQEMNIMWISVSANCLVHSFMYYYYLVSSFGVQVWWKRYLTQLQIVQFIVTIAMNSYWYYAYKMGYNCAGDLVGFWFGMFIIFSFLVLFVLFYISNYKSGHTDPSSPSTPRIRATKPKKEQ